MEISQIKLLEIAHEVQLLNEEIIRAQEADSLMLPGARQRYHVARRAKDEFCRALLLLGVPGARFAGTCHDFTLPTEGGAK